VDAAWLVSLDGGLTARPTQDRLAALREGAGVCTCLGPLLPLDLPSSGNVREGLSPAMLLSECGQQLNLDFSRIAVRRFKPSDDEGS
jgi:hypothetical protein